MLSFKYLAVACLLDATYAQSTSYVNQTNCNGKTYTYEELGGYGTIPGNARDKYGDTIGGIGSAIAMDVSSWTKLGNGSYTGVLWTLPDRGWSVDFFRLLKANSTNLMV
jgi:hypothetical protein